MTSAGGDTRSRSRERLQDVSLWRAVQCDFKLSDREIQVAILLVLGCSLSEIARRLGIGRGTVVTYVARVKRKCGTRVRSTLIVDLLLASGLLLDDGT